MTAGYRVPAAAHRVEDVIERSRFIASLERAASTDAARAFIDNVRAEFPDASHNCWAYIAGPPGSASAIGFSDAGEPHGTAGRPMLDVLQHSGIGEVVAVVTRYFGGTKLGKGGLVRAYGGAVQNALQSLPTIELVERSTFVITVTYGDVELLRRLLARAGAEISNEEYGADVQYYAALPVSIVEEFRRELADATAGRAVITSL
jgi:uncharacterized YigZ family protein